MPIRREAMSQLMDAVRANEPLNVALVLSQSGVNPDIIYPPGIMLLMHCASLAQTECIAVLLTAGADVHRTDMQGATALFYAIESRSTDCVKMLIEAGSDVNHVSEIHFTPLMIAVRDSKDYGIVKLLIDNGADKHYTARGFTALNMAELMGLKHLYRLLE